MKGSGLGDDEGCFLETTLNRLRLELSRAL